MDQASTSMVNGSRDKSYYGKKKGKGAIGLMAGMIFNRGGNSNTTNQTNNNRNSHNNNSNIHSPGNNESHASTSSARSISSKGSDSQREKNNSGRSFRTKYAAPTNNRHHNSNSGGISGSGSSSRQSADKVGNNMNKSKSSPQKTPAHQSEGLSPPIGLSGPTQFEFSPIKRDYYCSSRNNIHSKQKLRQHYLTFLSSHTPIHHHQHASITGSPVRTMGGGGIPGQNEKRLCVLELQQFYKKIDLMDEQQRHNIKTPNDDRRAAATTASGDDHNDSMIEPITDPNQLMDEHVDRLLNTSLPLNRPNDYLNQMTDNNDNKDSRLSISPRTSPTNRSYVGSPPTPIDDFGSPGAIGRNGNVNIQFNGSMSLEEKLRRERQRLHSNGITQFTWTICDWKKDEAGSSTIAPSKETNLEENPHLSPLGHEEPNRLSSSSTDDNTVRILVPLRGNIYIQDGVGPNASSPLRLLYDKSMLEEGIPSVNNEINSSNEDHQKKGKKRKGKKVNSNRRQNSTIKSVVGRDASAIDPQLSPDGSMVAFVVAGEIYVMSCGDPFHYYITDDDQSAESHGAVHNINDDEQNDSESDYNDKEKDNTNDKNKQLFDISGRSKPTRVTFGAIVGDSDSMEEDEEFESGSSSSEEESHSGRQSEVKKRYGRSITHGLADFVAQEEMDRFAGFWWDQESKGILFVQVDESCVPPYRITHQGKDGIAADASNYEDHRYPFAGENNPDIKLGYVSIDRKVILSHENNNKTDKNNGDINGDLISAAEVSAESGWSRVKWFDPPPEASEYLARVNWLPGGNSACVQWQDRRQSILILVKIDFETGENVILHKEQSDVWINLHHMLKVLPQPVHPNECLVENQSETCDNELPSGSFSFLFASERTGYSHLYLYTYVPGDFSATLLRAITAGEWIVESIVGVDMENDLVYVTGTYDSPLERHLYVLPLRRDKSQKATNGNIGVLGVRRGLSQVMNTLSSTSRKHIAPASSYYHAPPVCTEAPSDPIRLTKESGMHSIVMDERCRLFVDTSSDLTRPPSSKMYSTSKFRTGESTLLFTLYDATLDLKDDKARVSAPELISFATSDGSDHLHAALYSPDASVYGSGPYPLICAVYGGPHVQRVNRSWSQGADMRAQRLCSLGFAVVKCDNRGSARRGLAFEGAIKKNLGRVEVLDQVAAVRYLVMRGIADSTRVGIYGWSYGGYLAAMCLCRAPDVFHVAIAGAPVTSWDGYDTHYTERYMGLPTENNSGYHEAAVFQHIHNMRGKLMIIHGLIDENVHFRHTARLINRLIAAGKDYDLLIFPDERHSPRRLRDRVYMEKRMSDYFVKNLLEKTSTNTEEVLFMGHL